MPKGSGRVTSVRAWAGVVALSLVTTGLLVTPVVAQESPPYPSYANWSGVLRFNVASREWKMWKQVNGGMMHFIWWNSATRGSLVDAESVGLAGSGFCGDLVGAEGTGEMQVDPAVDTSGDMEYWQVRDEAWHFAGEEFGTDERPLLFLSGVYHENNGTEHPYRAVAWAKHPGCDGWNFGGDDDDVGFREFNGMMTWQQGGARRPDVPTLVSPDHGQVFQRGSQPRIVIRTDDPDGDAYYGKVEVADAQGTVIGETVTRPVMSGEESEGSWNTPLEPGAYLWRARGCDPLGSGDCSAPSEWRPFTVLPQSPPTVVQQSPTSAYTFKAEETQQFTVRGTDPEGDRYHGEVEVVTQAGEAVTQFPTPLADSGQDSTGVSPVMMREGKYRWRARGCDPAGSNTCSAWTDWRPFKVGPALRPSTYSDDVGLEQYFPYESWPTGAGPAYVNMANGNLVQQEVDLSVPGPINLRLTRTYNTSKDTDDGPLGRGWTLGVAEGEGMLDAVLDAALSLDVNRMVQIVGNEDTFEIFDGDGTAHHFAKGGTAAPGWHSPPGVNLTLTDGIDVTTGNRWYHATRPDGVRYEFNKLGEQYRLTRIADRKGNALTMTYTSGKLTSISDGAGRTVTLNWSGNYLTSAVYSASSQSYTVNYAVNATTQRLTSVTQAAGSTGSRTRGFTYDADGLKTVTDARGNVTTFTVAAGKVTGITDRGGNAWQLKYDAACSPPPLPTFTAACVVDPEGASRTWTLNAQGNPVAFTDEGDKDEAGNDRRNLRGFVYVDNQLQRQTDEAGNVTEYAYNHLGQITQQTATGAGEPSVVSQFVYAHTSPGAGDMTEARVAVGTADTRTWKFEYDTGGLGLLTRQIDPLGNASSFTYYTGGRLKTVTDPRNNTTTYGLTGSSDGGYHFTGQPTKITDPTGAFMTLAYDYMGRLTTKTDRLSKTWTSTYDARGNVLSSADPLGNTTKFCYDLNDNRTLTLKPKATATGCALAGTEPYVSKVSYDARDLPIETVGTSDGQLRKAQQVYAADGQLIKTVLPRSFASPAVTQEVTIERFPNNRVKAQTDPEGNRTDLVYTPNGLQRHVTEPGTGADRRTTVVTYNGRGQSTAVLVSGHSAPSRSEYNAHGELVRAITPKGEATTYVYDAAGRQTQTVDAQGRVSERGYDAAGNLVSLSQPADVGGKAVTTYTYTVRNQIASETDPADVDHTITYAYDAEGRQTTRSDVNSGTVTRTTTETRRDDGLVTERLAAFAATTTGQHKVVFTYDAHGNPTAVRTHLDGSATPNVSEITIDYTDADEPETWNETIYPPSGTAVTKTSTFTYAADGAPTSRTVDGLLTSYEHLRNGLETKTAGWSGVGDVTSTWTADGSLMSTTMPNGTVTSYTYDLARRPTSKIVMKGLTSLSAWQQVVYDNNDNRTGEVVSQVQPNGKPLKTGPGTYNYDSLNRLVKSKHPFDTTKKTKTYALDDGGNIVSDTDATYEYKTNRLVKVDPVTAGKMTFTYDQHGNQTSRLWEGDTTSYSYDAAGHPRRTTKPSGSWVEYAYDGFERMTRRDEGGTATLFFHDGKNDQIVLETDGAGVWKTRYLLDSGGDPLAQETSEKGWGWFITDMRNNMTQLLDSAGVVKKVQAYDPFGKDLTEHTDAESGWDSKLRYQMAPHDNSTGTYNLGPRLFDPAINRFVGADNYVAAEANMALALDPLTGNRYLYAGANPVGMIDDGHAWVLIAVRVGVGAISVARRAPAWYRAARAVIVAAGVARAVGNAHWKSTRTPAPQHPPQACYAQSATGFRCYRP